MPIITVDKIICDHCGYSEVTDKAHWLPYIEKVYKDKGWFIEIQSINNTILCPDCVEKIK